MMEELQGEDPVWTYKKSYYEDRLFFAEKLIKAYKKLTGYKILAHHMSFAKKLTYHEFCILAQEIQDFKCEFNEYWQSLKLDVAVCPIWPLVAPYHETTVKLAHAFSYSLFWNLLDFPAGVVPVKKVEKGENRYEYFSTDSFVKVAQENMKNSEGLPVCVQIVGSTYQDEKVLRVMKIVQDHFGFYELAKVD
jgi:fatty acid amide hydrolase